MNHQVQKVGPRLFGLKLEAHEAVKVRLFLRPFSRKQPPIEKSRPPVKGLVKLVIFFNWKAIIMFKIASENSFPGFDHKTGAETCKDLQSPTRETFHKISSHPWHLVLEMIGQM